MKTREDYAIYLSNLHNEWTIARKADPSEPPWFMDLLLEEVSELSEKTPLGSYELTLQDLATIAEKRLWCVLKEQLVDNSFDVEQARNVAKAYALMVRELGEQVMVYSVPTHHEEEVPVLQVRLLSAEACKYYVDGEWM